MTKFWKSLSTVGAALSVTVAGAAQAAPNDSAILDQLNNYSQEGRTDVAQVNSVFQLRDVAPSDWAFDALRNLVEKYNCIVGYPDGTFRGNRPLSRYEFAAGLNACMQQIERLIVGGGTDVDAADITRLRALVQEFEAELATLGARVDDIEGRVEFLEDNQFSTTTKLTGEVVFGLTDSFGDTSARDNGRNNINNATDDDTTETVFNNRVRLQLETSFTGKDTLITRLTAGNSTTLAPTGSGVGTLITDNLADNDIAVDWLAYYFPVGKANAYVAAVAGLQSDYVSTTFGAKGLEDLTGASGSLTYFAASSPIYLIGGGAGAGINFPAGPVEISLGYLADEHADPSEGAGLFNGDYGALAQIAFNIGDRIELGATYVNAYQTDSIFAFGGGSALVGSAGFRNGAGLVNSGVDSLNNTGGTESNTFGLQGRFDITDKVSLALFGLYSDVNVIGGGDEEIWSYAASLGFNDLGKDGNVLGLSVGVPPYVGGSAGGGDETPIQIEGFYKYQVNDNISVTPGVVWIDNAAEGFYGEDSALLGTVRTTFTF
ncbi:cyanobacterial porin [[Leptolyngbya] sp. PCC 7376]|uniref:iron uptake porin n=1 Tax=[Leptolyngbya] sp. PCC 7376 TaxID=111781 RepID=UPI00029ED779|nr:iron uptake porin [[Leptolyngbya] sp. PCC 7376]AFY38271.1 cyanobacterial porin [[Leptolyngbya] sp. PCC 7376]